MGVEGLDGFQPPGLTLLALGFRPGDGFPIGGEDKARAGIGQFHTVARRFPDIKEEGALDRVLVGAGFDVDAVFKEDVGGAQDVFALVGGVGEVMEAAVAFRPCSSVYRPDRRSCC